MLMTVLLPLPNLILDAKWKTLPNRMPSDKEVLPGKPVIAETRISVEHIIQLLAQGWNEEQILENYPRLTKEHLKVVFVYVHECLQDGLVFSDSKRPGG